jgi:transposase-like protein
LIDEEIKRWTARRKTALVLEFIQGETTIAEASRAYDLPPSELESWVEDGKKGMENALRANPQDVREQYERQLKEQQEAYGEAMLELRARKRIAVPAGRGREVIETIRQGPKADGFDVSIRCGRSEKDRPQGSRGDFSSFTSAPRDLIRLRHLACMCLGPTLDHVRTLRGHVPVRHAGRSHTLRRGPGTRMRRLVVVSFIRDIKLT